MESPSKILVPVDFSEPSRAALSYAAALGSRLGAEIDLLHVWRPANDAGAKGDLLTEFVSSDAGQEMMDWLTSFEQRGEVVARGRLAAGAAGEVPDVIVQVAEEGAYDLVVMATRGRTGLSLLLRNSIADEVRKRAPCPVVTLRAEHEANPVPTPVAEDLGRLWPT